MKKQPTDLQKRWEDAVAGMMSCSRWELEGAVTRLLSGVCQLWEARWGDPPRGDHCRDWRETFRDCLSPINALALLLDARLEVRLVPREEEETCS